MYFREKVELVSSYGIIYDVDILIDKYPNGFTKLQAIDSNTGEPIMTISTCPDNHKARCAEGECWIKDWGENAGMLQYGTDKEWWGFALEACPVGNELAYKVKLNIK